MNTKLKTGTGWSQCELSKKLEEQPEENSTIELLIGGETKKFNVDTSRGHTNHLVEVDCSNSKAGDYYQLRLVLGESTGVMKKVEKKDYNRIIRDAKELKQIATSS